MHTHTEIGHNRTGLPASRQPPTRGDDATTAAPADNPADATPDADGGPPERADLALKIEYACEADALGSMPPPSTLTGALKSGVDLLTGKRPQVLLDKLGERLAFERGGVRLYDALLVKCAGAADAGEGLAAHELDLLHAFRQQEADHAALLVEVLDHLGADPTVQTPCADLVGVESAGLVQAMNDPRTSLAQALHVMLDAELIDNASWELLIELAESAGHTAVAQRLETGLEAEAGHLKTLKALAVRLTLADAGVAGAPA